jgi:hypothetical protein
VVRPNVVCSNVAITAKRAIANMQKSTISAAW